MTQEIEQKRAELLQLVADELGRLDTLIDNKRKELDDLEERQGELETFLNYLES